MHKNFAYFYVVCALVPCLLHGCGFYLRGTFPQQVQTVYLDSQSPYSNFTKQLKNHLKTAHIRIVNDPKSAPITLEILDEQLTTRQISIGNSRKIQNHLAIYSVTYTVKSLTDKTIVTPTTIHIQRQIITLPTEELTNSHKLDEAKQTMIEDIAMKILLQLSTLAEIKNHTLVQPQKK
jgi:outer membrane lipopolysaccharide assembly protein LptE/RlpB